MSTEKSNVPTPESLGHADKPRQYKIDALCDWYTRECEAGRKVDMEAFFLANQEYVVDLAEYIVTYHLVLQDLPEPDETPEAERSPAFERALAKIHAEIERREREAKGS